MKKLTLIARIAFLASVIVAIATFPVGEFQGSPQQLVADIPEAAILEGSGPSGSILVDSAYLEEHGIYPQQLQTVVFLAESTRTVALYSALALMVGLLLLRWRMKSVEPGEHTLGAT